MAAGVRRRPLIVVLVIGLGLVAAPAIFQMFTRAPQGAEMIDEFRPFMTTEQVVLFQGYLAEIDAANNESIDSLRASIVGSGVSESDYEAQLPSTVGLNQNWPDIQADMGDLLVRMENNLDNYAAVDALPSFNLFPWFFVLPGLFIAGLAAWTLRAARRRGALPRGAVWALVGLGVAVVLAPAMFQMFSRAPKGGDMINDFRPMMTRERVVAVQSYFITMGAAEGELRIRALPVAAEAQGRSVEGVAADYPDIAQFSADWPTIVTDFAPMISAMSDNVDNFAAVDALPPFPLFPWFFVIPGLMVAAAALWGLKGDRRHAPGAILIDREGAAPLAEEFATGGKP